MREPGLLPLDRPDFRAFNQTVVIVGLEVFVPSVPYIGSVLVVGLFLWRVFARLLARIDARFDSVEARVDDRFDKVDERFDRVDERIDRVDERIDRVEGRLGGIEVKVGSLEGRFEGFEGRFRSLENKVDGLAKDHQNLALELADFRGEMRGRLSVLVPQSVGEA